ncbi:MAG: L,D-transpeptidase family protein [Alphaproteobacteria bacterium]
MIGVFEAAAPAHAFIDLFTIPAPVVFTLEDVKSITEKHQTEFVDAKGVYEFYAARAGKPYWVDTKNHAAALTAELQLSWQHGFNPANYRTPEVLERLSKADWNSLENELLLTDSFLRFVRDLTGARVRPDNIGMDPFYWTEPLTTAQILGLMQTDDFKNIIRDYQPQSTTYARLKEELIRLSAQPEEPYAKVLPINFGGLLKPGRRHARVPDLRLRMHAAQQGEDPLLYDDALFAKIVKLQEEHGLYGDGVIGPATLMAINRIKENRMLQLIANMERLRWVEGPRPDRFVLVNIPSEKLWAIEGGKISLEMDVIVGRPKRSTPSFITNIAGVRFNPTWTVPPIIKEEDILPKLQADPYYLQNKGIELVHGRGPDAQSIDPLSVDWNAISQNDLHAMQMVQIPGAHNPLGRVRVLMPNSYSIYLHDTNEKYYFDRATRAVSSGCIRMKEPDKMAAFILSGEAGWSPEKIEQAISTGRTRDIIIAEKIPVYLLYYTNWIDAQGRVVCFYYVY